MSPDLRDLLDSLTVERFTPWRDPNAPAQPKALRLIHDARAYTPEEQRRHREETVA